MGCYEKAEIGSKLSHLSQICADLHRICTGFVPGTISKIPNDINILSTIVWKKVPGTCPDLMVFV